MKCTVKTKSILPYLQNASRFTGSALSKVTALSGTLLRVLDTSLIVKATNINDFYEATVLCSSSQDGKMLVDGKKLVEFLALIPDKEVVIEKKDTSCVVHTSRGTGVFSCFDDSDYPDFPISPVDYVELNKEFIEAIPLVSFSASKEESRPILTGVYVDTSLEQLKLVSTDGFRLSVVSANTTTLPFPSSILSSRVLLDTITMLKESKSLQVGFNSDDQIFSFKGDDSVVHMRTIQGDFPAYAKVIPTSSQTIVEVDRQEMITNLKLCGIFARDYSNIVIFEVKKEEIRMRSKYEGEKNSIQTQGYISFSGEDLTIAFNYKFVLEFLQLVHSDTITISFGGSMSPCLFAPTDSLKEIFLHVIMPLRTDEVLT